ncbi:hypothetical protein SEPCBS119000_005925 [Sporothrix epigloea]|uniref:Zn(2)-C6 fungal-type domain-containing protein n=1 Tax=Sporothrix epigloea TaxID=1892477 RepID=A0ABP0E086_9PEZI
MANNDPSERRILPQSSQMNSFSFVTPPYQQQPQESQQKTYVFVDEHNRHKRLKVMRACEGCRRRKIKCDAATTNTWPCSACVRLKLQCVRPTVYDDPNSFQSYDEQPLEPVQTQPQQLSQQQQHVQQPALQNLSNSQHTVPPQQQQHPQQAVYNTSLDYGHQLQPLGLPGDHEPPQGIYETQTINYDSPVSVSQGMNMYAPVSFSNQSPSAFQYTAVPAPIGFVDTAYAVQQELFPTTPLQHGSHTQTPSDSSYIQNEDQANYSSADLADLLGDLRVNEAGSAPYLNQRMLAGKSGDEEAPAVGDEDEDYKSSLPPLVSGPGLKIRIPPELMPDDDTTLRYFDLYFANVHPYVPVLDKNAFMHQWQTNREAISPLLIEAVLALGGKLADDPAQGQQWLALATRHADSFMDVPRISTLQALLVMLKARETAPKRGYYYRSWMAVVQCVQMGKDLGLDEHFADHKAGLSCGLTPAECLLKTRIWQTIFVCEVMIGTPQGRTELSVQEDSVDLREPPLTPGVDESEMQVSRNFVYLARVICNVAQMNRIYGRIKRKKDWGTDPEFTRMSPLLHAWPNELPPDLTVTFAPDGSPPWIASSFVGNMHSYYYLSIILLHRPQLQLLSPSSPDGQWKQHMVACYSSAKLLCRLEEAILQTFGLNGLQNMQRGVNFTIYSVLTCILVHLIAITSPDPDFNSDAREYFTRHMRVLETCMTSWPMADMQRKIDAMREAFSADVRKPFVLKPTFPYSSPSPSSSQPSPPPVHTGSGAAIGASNPSFRSETNRTQPLEQIIHQQQQQHLHHHQLVPGISQANVALGFAAGHPISPPISVGASDTKTTGSPLHSASPNMLSVVSESQTHGIPSNIAMAAAPGWNPARIFDSSTSQLNTVGTLPSSSSGDASALQGIQAAHAGLVTNHSNVSTAYPTNTSPVQHTFVTPSMWQKSVASVYEGGIKRAWDYGS